MESKKAKKVWEKQDLKVTAPHKNECKQEKQEEPALEENGRSCGASKDSARQEKDPQSVLQIGLPEHEINFGAAENQGGSWGEMDPINLG